MVYDFTTAEVKRRMSPNESEWVQSSGVGREDLTLLIWINILGQFYQGYVP